MTKKASITTHTDFWEQAQGHWRSSVPGWTLGEKSQDALSKRLFAALGVESYAQVEQFKDFDKAYAHLIDQASEARAEAFDAERLDDNEPEDDAPPPVFARHDRTEKTTEPPPAPLPPAVDVPAANDWLVSVTPTPRGDFVTGDGSVRFNLTVHNGATADMVLATVEAMIVAVGKLAVMGITLTENGNGNAPRTPQNGRQDASSPPPRTSTPETANGAGEDVFGVGFVAEGNEFAVDIDRMKVNATESNTLYLELYRPGNRYPFARAFDRGNTFADIEAALSLNLTDARGMIDLESPVKAVFAVGKKKPNGDRHYIDYVRLA